MKKEIKGLLSFIVIMAISMMSTTFVFADENLTSESDVIEEYNIITDEGDGAFDYSDNYNLFAANSVNNNAKLSVNKLYRIKTTKGYCVAMPTNTFDTNGARAKLESISSGKMNQWWYILPGNGINFCLVNFATGKALEVTGASKSNNAQIGQWAVAPSATNQRWQLKAVNSRYVALYNVYTGKVMDIPNSNQYAGQNVNQYSYNGSTAQQFVFVSVSSSEYSKYTYLAN